MSKKIRTISIASSKNPSSPLQYAYFVCPKQSTCKDKHICAVSVLGPTNCNCNFRLTWIHNTIHTSQYLFYYFGINILRPNWLFIRYRGTEFREFIFTVQRYKIEKICKILTVEKKEAQIYKYHFYLRNYIKWLIKIVN